MVSSSESDDTPSDGFSMGLRRFGSVRPARATCLESRAASVLSAEGAGRPDKRVEVDDGPAAAFGEDDGPAEVPSSPKDDEPAGASSVSCRRRIETAFCRRSEVRWAELWQSGHVHGLKVEAVSSR